MISNESHEKYSPEVRKELDATNWEEIWPRLLKYAESRARKFRLLGITDLDPHDLVARAIALAYGTGPNKSYRNWNKQKYQDLTHFLISVIKSITSHTYDQFYPIQKDSVSLDATPVETGELVPLSPKSPETLLVEETDYLKLKQSIQEAIKGDEELELIFVCFEDGIAKPREISAETGYEIEKVNNALKRLRRKMKNLLKN